MTLELLAAYRLVAADVKQRLVRAEDERKPKQYRRILKMVYEFTNRMTGDDR
jgi:hypothetical protein